jgi:hypothetical protein
MKVPESVVSMQLAAMAAAPGWQHCLLGSMSFGNAGRSPRSHPHSRAVVSLLWLRLFGRMGATWYSKSVSWMRRQSTKVTRWRSGMEQVRCGFSTPIPSGERSCWSAWSREPHSPRIPTARRQSARLARRLWVPAPAGHRFQSVAGLAQRWADTFSATYHDAGSPIADHLLRRAVELCQHRASDTESCTMANRDLHLGNVLAAQREPSLAIDPKPPGWRSGF